MSRNVLQTVFTLVSILMLISCYAEEAPEAIELARFGIDKDCDFWLEGDEGGAMLRAGIVGACRNMTLKKYSLGLERTLEIHAARGIDKSKIGIVYLNIYESNPKMGIELIGMLNNSKAWSGECAREKNDICFGHFNDETRYLQLIEDVITKHFGKKFSLSFVGTECVPKDFVSKKYGLENRRLHKMCYPLTFGLAVFESTGLRLD